MPQTRKFRTKIVIAFCYMCSKNLGKHRVKLRLGQKIAFLCSKCNEKEKIKQRRRESRMC